MAETLQIRLNALLEQLKKKSRTSLWACKVCDTLSHHREFFYVMTPNRMHQAEAGGSSVDEPSVPSRSAETAETVYLRPHEVRLDLDTAKQLPAEPLRDFVRDVQSGPAYQLLQFMHDLYSKPGRGAPVRRKYAIDRDDPEGSLWDFLNDSQLYPLPQDDHAFESLVSDINQDHVLVNNLLRQHIYNLDQEANHQPPGESVVVPLLTQMIWEQCQQPALERILKQRFGTPEAANNRQLAMTNMSNWNVPLAFRQWFKTVRPFVDKGKNNDTLTSAGANRRIPKAWNPVRIALPPAVEANMHQADNDVHVIDDLAAHRENNGDFRILDWAVETMRPGGILVLNFELEDPNRPSPFHLRETFNVHQPAQDMDRYLQYLKLQGRSYRILESPLQMQARTEAGRDRLVTLLLSLLPNTVTSIDHPVREYLKDVALHDHSFHYTTQTVVVYDHPEAAPAGLPPPKRAAAVTTANLQAALTGQIRQMVKKPVEPENPLPKPPFSALRLGEKLRADRVLAVMTWIQETAKDARYADQVHELAEACGLSAEEYEELKGKADDLKQWAQTGEPTRIFTLSPTEKKACNPERLYFLIDWVEQNSGWGTVGDLQKQFAESCGLSWSEYQACLRNKTMIQNRTLYGESGFSNTISIYELHNAALQNANEHQGRPRKSSRHRP